MKPYLKLSQLVGYLVEINKMITEPPWFPCQACPKVWAELGNSSPFVILKSRRLFKNMPFSQAKPRSAFSTYVSPPPLVLENGGVAGRGGGGLSSHPF